MQFPSTRVVQLWQSPRGESKRAELYRLGTRTRGDGEWPAAKALFAIIAHGGPDWSAALLTRRVFHAQVLLREPMKRPWLSWWMQSDQPRQRQP
jgi:hypothetical protein